MNARYQPWLDRAGRLSWLKLVTFVCLFVPGLWVALQLSMGWLAPKPITEAIHQIGFWAIRLMLLSLLVTPLRSLGSWPKLIAIRRMLGLAVLAYGLIHFGLYIVDQHGDIPHVTSEILLRFYLTIGFIALLGLAVLGITSTDGMIRRVGARNWNRLHQAIYAIGFLALWHFMLQAKLDVTQPVLMAGFFIYLIGYRIARRFGVADHVPALIGLAVGAALATAGLEAGWYQIVNHVPFTRVFPANFDFDDELRPAWWVLFGGLCLAAVRVARPFWSKRPPVGRRASQARATA